jgi:hypothetical protein
MSPKVAKGGSQMEQASFLGMQVMPGSYKLKMKLNGKEFLHPLTFIHDSTDKEFTPADRLLQYQVGLKLYAMNEQLNTLVDSIQSRLNALQKEMDETTKAKTKKALQNQYDALEKLRLELVPPVVKGTGEIKRLRSDISELYVSVAGQAAAPGNLQQKRADGLQQELKKAELKFEELKKAYEGIKR